MSISQAVSVCLCVCLSLSLTHIHTHTHTPSLPSSSSSSGILTTRLVFCVYTDVRRARAPSKKKFDEEMEALVNSIRKTEEELEALVSLMMCFYKCNSPPTTPSFPPPPHPAPSSPCFKNACARAPLCVCVCVCALQVHFYHVVVYKNSTSKVTLTGCQKNAGPASFADALKNLKAEKNANIERRKKIDADLQKLNKEISEMVGIVLIILLCVV